MCLCIYYMFFLFIFINLNNLLFKYLPIVIYEYFIINWAFILLVVAHG
jgi:hypothetical protein